MVSDLSARIRAAIACLSEASGAAALRGDGWRPTGLLAGNLVERRYGNVPAEAFPFLDSGADGCHYGLWIDDAAQAEEPPVVWVCPMDGTPETIQLVANDAGTFLEMVTEVGLWRAGNDALLARRRDEAVARRRERTFYETRDGMGVVSAVEPRAGRPVESTLRRWRWEAPHELSAAIEEWLARGAPGLALAVVRDLIAEHDAAGLPRFGEECARVYRALGRNLHARVAAQ